MALVAGRLLAQHKVTRRTARVETLAAHEEFKQKQAIEESSDYHLLKVVL